MWPGDLIGWSCEQSWCPISYEFSTQQTYFYNSGSPISSSFPRTGGTYTFSPFQSTTWSVAVDVIQTSKFEPLNQKYCLFFITL